MSKAEFIAGIIRDVEAGRTVHVTGRERLLTVIDWIATDTTDRSGWCISTSIDNRSLWIRKEATP